MARSTAQSFQLWRQSLVAAMAIALVVGLFIALQWIRRDITYWSKGTTFTYQTDSLETCARLVALSVPGVSVLDVSQEIHLRVPGHEGAIIKPASEQQVAWLVIYGHSESVARLGPAAEESVKASLAQLGGQFTELCSDR